MTETQDKPVRRSPRVVFKLALLTLSLFLTLAVAELGFRLFVDVTDVAFQFWDPCVGVRRKPSQHGTNIAGANIRAKYNFNQQGWNYPRDFTVTRKPDTTRLCLVGDSYVEAMQVDCDKQMAVVLEQSLTAAGRAAECYPFGCSGFGTAQDYQVIRHYALDYKPDVVLIFFVQNDVYDCSPYLGGMESAVPVFSLTDAGELQAMGASYWDRPVLRRMIANMALTRYFIVQRRLLERGGAPRGPGNIVRREMSGQNTERFLGGNMSEAGRAEKSWLLIEKLLLAAKSDCDRAGAKLGVVYRGSVSEIRAAEKGEKYQAAPRPDDPYCMNQRIDEMGRDYLAPITSRIGIPYFDLTQTLVFMVKSTGRIHNFPDDDHYNADAHQAAGKAMAAWVQSTWPHTRSMPASN